MLFKHKQFYKKIDLLNQKINDLEVKINYIYEAVVGEKKNNPNFIFDTIYKQKMWGTNPIDDRIGSSGPGSDPNVLTGYILF